MMGLWEIGYKVESASIRADVQAPERGQFRRVEPLQECTETATIMPIVRLSV